MSLISEEVVSKLSALQNQIWQTVSLTVSEAAGWAMNFTSPITTGAKIADLYSEMAAPMMVIQFSFTSLPENAQVILVPQETVAHLAEIIKDVEKIDEIDENIVADLRAPLEGIIQGICLSVGNIKNEAVVASGMSLRFQIFSFPPNLQKSVELIRTQVAVTGDDLTGSLMWLMDSETAHSILGISPEEEEEEPAASPFQAIGGAMAPGQNHTAAASEDTSGLDLLLDIPLEISVELGRMKMLVRDVVELGTGSIVEIDKAAGEPVDVMVNGRLVARGEVVVIEDNFGVRITEILNPHERVNKVGDAA